jgi:diadenosine tetraphosphate (Ap4A) HIT family hydrolase
MEWPNAFYEMRSGLGCPMCEEGRPATTANGVRFFEGAVADAYLRRSDIQRGLSIVVWRGRHVAEPTELTESEADAYWRELLTVGRAVEGAFEPVKVNYNLLGNSLPHLHTHVVPRYADDPRPGWPFPFPEEDSPDMQEEVLRRDSEMLRAFLT